MRIVPIDCIKAGAFLGKTIFDDEGRTLLKEGVTLTPSILSRVKLLNINYLYIVDEYSTEEIEDIIKPELRQKAIQTVKNHFANVEKMLTSNDSKKSFSDLIKLAEELIDEVTSKNNILVNLVDIKSMDNYTYQHCVNVAVLSLILGIKLQLLKSELLDLCIGAMLHDIGKVFIPKEIIIKPGALTDTEYEIIKSHPTKGYDYLKNIFEISTTSRLIVLQHHERVNGSGYPYGKDCDKINLLSKIVSIADVYDALTSARPYRKALCPNDAIEYILANSGTLFDHSLVQTFMATIIPYPIGTLVKLSNGDVCVVDNIESEFPLRPNVKIIKSKNPLNIGKVVSLIDNLSLVICETVISL